jgi:hypothetical protein
MENDLSFTRKKIFLAELLLFVVLWTVNFFAFYGTKGLMVIPYECSFAFNLPMIPYWIVFFIRYGAWVSFLVLFICSFLAGFHTPRERIKECVLAFVLFSIYASVLELLFPAKIKLFGISIFVDWLLFDMIQFALTIPIANAFGSSASTFFSTLLRRKSCQR